MRSTALVIALVLLGAPPEPLTADDSARVVAIGDIHGAIEEFKRILTVAGLADAKSRWSGGRTTFIQTGDYMDRGAGTRAVLDLLMALEPQARKAGGRATSLLGNHEVMNLIGDTRDATAEIYAAFTDSRSESRRLAAWEAYTRLGAAKTAKGETVPAAYQQTREVWMAAHPQGYVEYREALGPKGIYGAWLRRKDVATEHGGSIFMHAGIAPDRTPAKIDDLNDRVRSEVHRLDQFVQRLVDAKLALPFFTLQEVLGVASHEIGAANTLIAAARERGEELDRSRLNVPLLTDAQEILKIDQWTSIDPGGALWYRGFSQLPDDPSGGPFAPLLARYGAKRFVTGHTPQSDRRITVRYGGRIVLIDTGMLSYYRGRASALEIAGDALTAIYDDGRVPLIVETPR